MELASQTTISPKSDPSLVGKWVLDPKRTTVIAKQNTFWGLKGVTASFLDVKGEGVVNEDASTSGTIEISVNSLTSKNEKRDAHLKGADFFDVEHHPKITINIAVVEIGANDNVEVSGSITVRGIRNPFRAKGTIHRLNAKEIRLDINTTLDRATFQMEWNQMGMIKGLTNASVSATFTKVS